MKSMTSVLQHHKITACFLPLFLFLISPDAMIPYGTIIPVLHSSVQTLRLNAEMDWSPHQL